MKRIFIILILLSTGTLYGQSDPLSGLFKEIEQYETSLTPEDSLFQGMHINGAFGTLNEEIFQVRLMAYKRFLQRLNAIDDQSLTRQAYISKHIMALKLQDEISTLEFNWYRIPINAEGGFYQSIGWALARLPFNTEEDYQHYITWLPAYVDWLEAHLKLMKDGIKSGIVAPRVVIQNNIKLLATWTDERQSPLSRPFQQLPKEWDKGTRDNIRQQGMAVIRFVVIPFYQKLINFLQSDYLQASPTEPGVHALPQGKAYYENRIRHYTTLNITPDSVHRLGLQEVARIRSLMDKIIKEVKFKGSFDEFLTFLRTDKQFYAKSPQELLNHAAWLSKKAEGQLPAYFTRLYSLPFTVAPVPDDIAPTYTGGRYVPGSWDQQRAGTYWVNTYKLDSRPLYTLPPLTLHEAVPGHHLQGAIAGELTDIPTFRNRYYISAFGEGWGLYSEFLGEEMGMYTTPYEWFGRYTYEMWRACRLVIDTGIHYKGWTREQAVAYMQSNTALSLHEVNTEIDRYIGWPGQAVSYKIGELKIKALRQLAEDTQGNSFDIREFHQQILRNGSVPLTILEDEVRRYIANP